jgi:DNA mismatch repair ATPase MutL
MARQLAIKPGKTLGNEEMLTIVNELFASKVPEVAPDGSPTLKIITLDEIGKIFKNKV